jgi:DNA-binding Lrp family transcriptional regulator
MPTFPSPAVAGHVKPEPAHGIRSPGGFAGGRDAADGGCTERTTMPSPDAREARLLNGFQRGIPLVHEPYAAIARELATDEGWVRSTLARWQRDGVVSRIGAVFRAGSIGVSTLAALAVPPEDLVRVAAMVSARPEVNHNYEREHRYNLWFVAAAADASALAAVLDAIHEQTGYAPIALPLVADYWIDLGFDLSGVAAKHTSRARRGARVARGIALSAADRRLVAVLEGGLPLVPAPYAVIADAAGVSEAYVQVRLADWLNQGVIKRLGVVVRHRELGYVANAMCVWDVPDAPDAGAVDALGEALAREPGVTLCYRRARALPEWRYNLFCMLHGRDRATVEARVAELSAAHALARFPSAVLFSRRAFKQCGARYGLGAPGD